MELVFGYMESCMVINKWYWIECANYHYRAIYRGHETVFGVEYLAFNHATAYKRGNVLLEQHKHHYLSLLPNEVLSFCPAPGGV
jgi:hypothetical protein